MPKFYEYGETARFMGKNAVRILSALFIVNKKGLSLDIMYG